MQDQLLFKQLLQQYVNRLYEALTLVLTYLPLPTQWTLTVARVADGQQHQEKCPSRTQTKLLHAQTP